MTSLFLRGQTLVYNAIGRVQTDEAACVSGNT